MIKVICNYPDIHTAVMCQNLVKPVNGTITFSEETTGFMVLANYSCITGYALSGGNKVRMCIGSPGSSGEWNGTAPTCEGEWNHL